MKVPERKGRSWQGNFAFGAVEQFDQQLERLRLSCVVITCLQFNCLAGSQLVALDLARTFSRLGASVYILTDTAGGLICEEAIRSNIQVVAIADGSWKSLPKQVDLVWGMHWPVLGHLLLICKITFRFLVQSSLSHFEPRESLWLCQAETDRFVFGNRINRELHRDRVLEASMARSSILLNSLPFDWFLPICKPPGKLRIGIISNHPPPELLEAARMIKARGIEVQVLGMATTPTLVDRYLVDSFSCLICIGHTVVKSLARCRPVYIYDRFGGTGWLDTTQLDKFEHHNYSGRGGGRRRNSSALVDDILTGVSAKISSHSQAIAFSRYSLEKNVSEILATLQASTARSAHDEIATSVLSVLWSKESQTALDDFYLFSRVSIRRVLSVLQPDVESDVIYRDIVIKDEFEAPEELDAFEIVGNVCLIGGEAVKAVVVIRDDAMSWYANANQPSPWLVNVHGPVAGIERAFYSARVAINSETRWFNVVARNHSDKAFVLARIEVGEDSQSK